METTYWNQLPITPHEVAEMYRSGLPMDAIAVALNTTKRTIANRLIDAGVKSRGYGERFNTVLTNKVQEYFNDWGNQSAYILGYTMADGSVCRPKDRSPGVYFACAERDREILDGIARELELPFLPKQERKRPVVRLRIHGERFAALFESFGILPRKSFLNCPFPDMRPVCVPNYLRGVFDGDGCVYHRDDFSSVSVQFLGSEKFIHGVREHLVSRAGVRSNSVCKRPGHYCVAWQNPTAIKEIHDFIYPEGEYLFLSRKRAKFRSIIEHAGLS